jgi:hypothetical protein
MTTTNHSHKAWTDKGGHVISAQMGVPKEVMEPTPLAITVHCLHEL